MSGDMLSQIFGSIEGTEQSVIQHLRTCGLRKASETSLIDEILNIRRERRRIFTDLMQVCESLRNQNKHLEKQLHVTREEVVQAKKASVTQLDELQQTYARELKVQTEAQKKKHELKLKEVGVRLEDLISNKNAHDEASLQDAAFKLTQVELDKQREVYDSKLLRYKQAVRDMVEREKQHEAMASRHAKLYQEGKEETKTLRELLANQQGSQHANVRLIGEMKAEVDGMRAAIADQHTYIQSLQLDTERRQERALHDIKEQAEKHAQELAAIDAQVRQALARKEGAIQRLQQTNRALLQDQHAMEVGLQSVFERTN